jgi:hypothetical protein
MPEGINRIEARNRLRLKADNSSFGDFEVEIEQIKEVWEGRHTTLRIVGFRYRSCSFSNILLKTILLQHFVHNFQQIVHFSTTLRWNA